MISPHVKIIAAVRTLQSRKLVLSPGKSAGGGLEAIGKNAWIAPRTYDRDDPTIERGVRWVTYSEKAKWQVHSVNPWSRGGQNGSS